MKTLANALLIFGVLIAVAGILAFQTVGSGGVRGGSIDAFGAIAYIAQFVGAGITLFGGVLHFVAGGVGPANPQAEPPQPGRSGSRQRPSNPRQYPRQHQRGDERV
jgi:hypothetical protein